MNLYSLIKDSNFDFANDSSLILFLCGCILQLKEIVNHGQLVSDEIIINLLSKRLEAGEAKGESGFILDGFPRTIRQAVSSSCDLLLFIFPNVIFYLGMFYLLKFDNQGFLGLV